MMSDDMALVRAYAAQQSEPAFETLVARHAGLVHSAALRQVGDEQLAGDITQTVFLILARKAGALNPNTILPGWLYRTTRFVAAAALKIQRRRERREQEALAMMQETNGDPAWEQLSPLLDEAMAQLPDKDRDALVLRFFQNKSLRDVGAVFGVDEYAAQKRVARALEKLRARFLKQGVRSTASIIAGLISANSIQAAPAALVKTTTATVLAQGTAAGGVHLPLLKGAMKLMAWHHWKVAALTGTAILLTAAVVFFATGLPGGATTQPDLQGAWQTRLYFYSKGGVHYFVEAEPVLNIYRTNGEYQAALDFIGLGVAHIAVHQFTYQKDRVSFHTLGFAFDGLVNSNATEICPKEGKPVLTRLAQPRLIPPPLTDSDCARKSFSPQGRWTALEDFMGTRTEVDLNIAGRPDGSFRVEAGLPMFGLHQIPITNFTYQPPVVKLALAEIPFEGRLDRNGDELAGDFVAGKDSVPGVFHRAESGGPPSFTPANKTDVVGHWAADWNSPRGPLHLQLNLGRLANGKLAVTLDSPDEGQVGIAATLVHRSRGVYLGLQWQGVGYSFEGKMSGNRCSGTWREKGVAVPLVFERIKPTP
jgi:RNA polymerase sigma factor (sigma-70 family)